MVGDVIAERYELEALVGTGGMSSVFRAHDRLLERTVALKILHDQYTQDADYVERFRREAQAVAQLSHPNIVTVIDRGEFGGRQFIVFEYVEGQNLRQLVDRVGPLPIAQALDVTLQVARALAFAHQEGLVHRDVKPQNVLVSPTGQAKVTDFGIARVLNVQGLTETGTVLGTSHYIAPEQAHGGPVDPHSDVYSLAVVLFELLTGDVPFTGDNFVAVALRHVNEPAPSVRGRRSDVSPRLSAAVDRALAKNPADRFDSMRDFVVELESCRAELGAPAEDETVIVSPQPRPEIGPPGPPRARRRWPVVAAAALAVAAAIAAAAVLLIQDSDKAASSGTPRNGGGGAAAIQLRAVRAWDPPPGDGQEHDADVGKATDGSATTFWYTEHYNSPQFGGLKPGVGLVLDAAGGKAKKIVVETDTPGFTAQIKAGDSAGGPFSSVVSASRTVNGTTTFPLSDASARYYLLWITQLPPDGEAHVNEVRAG